MDIEALKETIETKVYHIQPDREVPLHEHPTLDEVFYCNEGSGVGIVEDQEFELNVGDVFVAPAGKMHSIRNDEPMVLTAILIPVNRIVCHCNQVSYADIRKAMACGARTVEEIREITGAGTGCGNCIGEIEHILSIACGCTNVSMDDAVNALHGGADTVEKMMEATGAGNGCGKCRHLLQNIIDIKR